MAVRSPLGRQMSIWSHNTNYPGAVGLHHENGKGAHARDVTIKKDHSNIMSHIEAIHRKELQSMRFNQRALRNSMLAYTEKMRRISLEKITTAECGKLDSGRSDTSGRKLSSLSRITEKSSSTATSSHPALESNHDLCELDRFSPSSDLTALSALDSVSVVSSIKGTPKRKISEDASTLTGGDVHGSGMRKDMRRLSPIHSHQSMFVTQGPRRRAAVTEAPNLNDLSFDRSEPRQAAASQCDDASEMTSLVPDNVPDTGRMSRGSDRFLDFDTDNEDISCEITPFPKLELPAIVVQESETDATDSVVSVRTSKKNRRRKKRSSERETPAGAAPAPPVTAVKTPTPTPCKTKVGGAPPFKARPKSDPSLMATRNKRPPTPPKPVFHHFRYSEAMAAALKSMTSDSSESPDSQSMVLSYLPSGDLEAARSDSVCTDVSRSVSESSSPRRPRRLSVSLPLSPCPDSDRSSEGEECASILKSVLRKKDSGDTAQCKKKSVQFKLPTIIPISPRPLESFEDPFSCRQSETTVNIVRLED